MNDAVPVRVVQGRQDLQTDLDDLGGLQPLIFRQEGPQVPAGDELHDHEVRVVGGAPVVDAHDARVVQDCCRASLSAEPLDETTVARQVLMQHLQGHVPGQDRVMGAIDLAHTTRCDPGDDLVTTLDGGFDD